MFDWQPYMDSKLIASSDMGNCYYITPVDEQQPDGPWTCAGEMFSGTDYHPRLCESRHLAEAYAEELEIQSWVD